MKNTCVRLFFFLCSFSWCYFLILQMLPVSITLSPTVGISLFEDALPAHIFSALCALVAGLTGMKIPTFFEEQNR